MSRKQSKRSAFAERRRRERFVARVHKLNAAKPGYLGAARNVTVTTADGRVERLGGGAMFLFRLPLDTTPKDHP